jgi:hypothetical protein
MAAPVWILSVDLSAKTAAFQSGMSDAAKSARTSFTDIKSGANDMGGAVGGAMGSSRQGVMLLAEEFGVHLPRGIVTFLSSLGPVGSAMTAAFPFVAIVVGASLLLQHLAKLKLDGQELTQDQIKFGTAALNAFRSLDEKLLASGIKADELRNDHLGALHKQLKLIDMQSMDDLVHTFGEIAKASDATFERLKVSWYQWGEGSTKAKQDLDEYMNKFASLHAQGRDAEATDLFKSTRDSAQKTLDFQKQAAATTGHAGGSGDANRAALLAHEAALNGLKQTGRGFTEKEIASQQQLLDVLNDQGNTVGRIGALKKSDQSNATTTTGKEMGALRAAAQKEAAEHSARMGEIQLATEREQSQASLAIARADADIREAEDVTHAGKEAAIKQTANSALIAALDKGGKDYNNQLKALQDKGLEIEAEHAAAVAGIRAKADEAFNTKSLADMEGSERQKINATATASTARLAVIDAAIKAEQAAGLDDTAHFRELLAERVEVGRQAAEETAKQAAEAGKLLADSQMRTDEMALAAYREHLALMNSGRHISAQVQVEQEIGLANQSFATQMMHNARDLAALDKNGKDFENKRKAIEDREKEQTQQHANDITYIKTKAEIERNQKIQAAEEQYTGEMAASLTQALMGQKSFAAAMQSLGSEVVSSLMQQELQHIAMNMLTKQSDASTAAGKAFNIGLGMGGPAGIILGPVFAASAYAGVMAFNSGTDGVPGIGNRDVVPAMLTPGEGIVPGGVMDGLSKMAKGDGFGSGGKHYHLTAHFAPTVHAVDAIGVDRMLHKHADKFQRHFENTVRKMNR